MFVQFQIDTGRLYTGHTSVFGVLRIGTRWRFWVMRWDVARAPQGRLRSRDGLVGWTWSATTPWSTPMPLAAMTPTRAGRPTPIPTEEESR